MTINKEFLTPVEPRIVRYLSGVHMGANHAGLRKLVTKFGLDLLENGEFIVFMNTAQNAFKLMAPNNVLIYYRHPKNHRIDPRVISLIPKVFDGKELKMDLALKKVLEKNFAKKRVK